MIYNILSIICLIIMMVGVGIIIYCFFSKKGRLKRIQFIRGFKKGKCFLIFIVALILYMMGIYYSKYSLLYSFFISISNTIDLVVLKFKPDSIIELCNVCKLYKIAVIVCYILVIINAILFAISVLYRKIWQWFNLFRFQSNKKEKYIILGSNEKNCDIYESYASHQIYILDKKSDISDISQKRRDKLFLQGVRNIYFNKKKWENIAQIILKKITIHSKYYIIIQENSDEENIGICNQFLQYITNHKEDIIGLKTKNNQVLNIYVIGNPEYENMYLKLVSKSYGCLHYLNKYKLIANDFVDHYPFAQYVTSDHVDYKTSLFNKNTNMNVAIIGFGKTNQEIFLTCVANNQFVTGSVQNPILKPVNYYIFDKENMKNRKNLNHNYFRFQVEKEILSPAEEEYLPFPDAPANVHFADTKIDVNDIEFYKHLYHLFKEKEKNENNVNFVIIAFGTDLENIDMAQKIVEKKQDWNLKCVNIFVKVRNHALIEMIQNSFAEKDFFIFGNEKEVVYNCEKIINEKFSQMALKRHISYAIENEITEIIEKEGKEKTRDFIQISNHQFKNANKEIKEKIDKVVQRALDKWYNEFTQIERDSNAFGCLSLRSKLLLMGLDYTDDVTVSGLTEEEFMRIYAQNDLPNYHKYDVRINGKRIIHYNVQYVESRRRVMTIQEHYRWNAYMITKGMVPSSKKQIIEEKKNGKNYQKRRHGNLTTFEGLIEFRNIVVNKESKLKSNKTKTELEESCDVIKYDYQILDDAWWLLHTNGYKIILKKDKSTTSEE